MLLHSKRGGYATRVWVNQVFAIDDFLVLLCCTTQYTMYV